MKNSLFTKVEERENDQSGSSFEIEANINLIP